MALAGAGALVTSVFGAGNSEHTNQNGSSQTTNSQKTLTGDTETNKQTGKTVNKTVNVNKGYTGNTTKGTTTSGVKGNVAGTQTAKSGGTQTTVGTADNQALATARGLTSSALADSTDSTKTQGLIDSTLHQAAIAFAPTLAAGTAGSGLYNGSTVSLLSGNAQAQATADATQAVLNYQEGEQQIAQGANSSILDATKGTTGTTSNTSTGSTNTDTTQNTDTANQQTNDTASIDTQKANDTQTSSTLDTISKLLGINTSGTGTANQNANTNSSGDSGGVFSSLSLVCAEMLRQDKMELRLWVMINRHFLESVGPLGKIGYWTWAGPVAWFARKNPEHWFTRIMFWLTEERACYVAAKYLSKTPKYKITRKGWLSYWLIFGFSYFVAIITTPARVIYTKFFNAKMKKVAS